MKIRYERHGMPGKRSSSINRELVGLVFSRLNEGAELHDFKESTDIAIAQAARNPFLAKNEFYLRYLVARGIVQDLLQGRLLSAGVGEARK